MSFCLQRFPCSKASSSDRHTVAPWPSEVQCCCCSVPFNKCLFPCCPVLWVLCCGMLCVCVGAGITCDLIHQRGAQVVGIDKCPELVAE